MAESLLDAVRVVLYEPQDPVNIAATVRAMKNMGASHLRLVNPAAYDAFRIEGVAHDTREIVEAIEHYSDLAGAIADCVRVAGFTARRRSAKLQVVTPKEAAASLLASASDGPVAIVFGREDKGLPNSALDESHLVVTVPTTGHASLNLAQSVLIALYEMHLAAGDATRELAPPKKLAPAPTSEQYDLFFADAARALEEIAFFKTRNAEHIMRSLRSLLFRAGPDARELSLLRAMAIEVLRTVDRIRRESGRSDT
ncbi:MAG TPA: TrmH family RNA methyltransferase [Gemmatimonadaceae bacterium]|jgi:TrmH family RNA methyltransferase